MRRKKSSVRKGKGSMCNVCGLNCGKGGALKKHVESIHNIEYTNYKNAYYQKARNILTDVWDDSVKTKSGKRVVTHVLVRRFIRNSGERAVRK